MNFQDPDHSISRNTKGPREAISHYVLRCLGPLLDDDFEQMRTDLKEVYFERAEAQYQNQLARKFHQGDKTVKKLGMGLGFEASDSQRVRKEGQKELIDEIESLSQEELVKIVSELREMDRSRIMLELEVRAQMLGSFVPMENLRPKFGVQGEFWVEGAPGARKVHFRKY